MIRPGDRATYLDSGYTGLVLQAGTIPPDYPQIARRGQPGYQLRWELLDEQTGHTVPGSDGGTSWVLQDQLSPL